MQDRKEIVQLIVHAADLSAQALDSKDTAYEFGQRCLREFHKQCGREGDLGIEESGFMKGLDKPLQQAKAQLGFISFVLLPLWADFAAIFSSMTVSARTSALFVLLPLWVAFAAVLRRRTVEASLSQVFLPCLPTAIKPEVSPGWSAISQEGCSCLRA